MIPARSTVETRRRWACLAYGGVIAVHLVVLAVGDSELGLAFAFGAATGRLLLAGLMTAGQRWGWVVAVVAETVIVVTLLALTAA